MRQSTSNDSKKLANNPTTLHTNSTIISISARFKMNAIAADYPPNCQHLNPLPICKGIIISTYNYKHKSYPKP